MGLRARDISIGIAYTNGSHYLPSIRVISAIEYSANHPTDKNYAMCEFKHYLDGKFYCKGRLPLRTFAAWARYECTLLPLEVE